MKFLVLFVVFITNVVTLSRAETATCLAVYTEGGAHAVFESSDCPRWQLPRYTSLPGTVACQWALHKGRRPYQEDRILCALDVPIPFLGMMGLHEVSAGIVAVFDGHNGAEASEMVSKLLLEYFVLHSHFLIDTAYTILLQKYTLMLPIKGELDVLQEILNRGNDTDDANSESYLERFGITFPVLFDGSFHLEILKQSLLKAIRDVDVVFSKEASEKNISSGSTAAILLMADGHILVANIGDSKVILCSEKLVSDDGKGISLRKYKKQRRDMAIFSPRSNRQKITSSNRMKYFSVKELTSDHHPDRPDERSRVESSGGYILEWAGVSRVNGMLAVSRAIGDLSYKSYGVTAAPEVTDWQPLDINDSYVVAASDGVFEKMDPQDICDILWELHNDSSLKSDYFFSCPGSMAECIVNIAFAKGSMDNLAAIVVPLNSTYSSTLRIDNWHVGKYNTGFSHPQKLIYDRAGMMGLHEVSTGIVAVFHGHNGAEASEMVSKLLLEYFVLHSHFLIDTAYTILLQKYTLMLPIKGELDVLQEILNKGNGTDDANSESYLERYELLKRFDRGSCGEVWLAFLKNYSQECNGSDWDLKNKKCHFYSMLGDGNLKINFFILKFIMADRGNSNYLSGLREKYFGEIFGKASIYWQGSLSGFHEPGSRILDGFEDKNTVQQKVEEEGLSHIARYIESYMTHMNQICLVFHHEGVSLSKLMYTDNSDEENNGSQRNTHPLQPSKWWHWLKITKEGQEEMRNIIWQLLMAIKSCHDRNITHRDIKLANMVVCFEDLDTGSCSKEVPISEGNYITRMRIIDFGSAIDEYTLNHLYGSAGPSSAEQTDEYAPPEALLNRSWYKGPVASTLKYDMWSVGVVMLEMILGSPDVFQINSFARILLDRQLAGWSESLKDIIYRLMSLMEFCILCVGDSSKHGQQETSTYHEEVSPAPWKCSEEYISLQLKNRDPLRLGFPNVWALRLVRQLLLWDPEERLGVDDALKHPYFYQPLLQT